MTVASKNLRFGYLLCVLFLVLSQVCLAQNPRRHRRPQVQQQPVPNFSTAEQEAQPNTAYYPQAPVYTNPAPDPNTQPVHPVAAPAASNPTPRNPDTGVKTPNPPTAQPNQPPVTAQTPQNHGLIGPPAPIPPTPEQMPPSAPKVIFQNGLLSVESVNSRLIDILNGIRNKTGMQFEGVQASPERVAGKFGPAPPDEVLRSLLQGSKYDYVIIGTPDRPEMVQRVILTPSGSAPAVAGTTPAPGASPQTANGEEEDNGSDEGGDPTPEQVQMPERPQTPAVAQPRSTAAPKTTEQLLEELKQMQQQQQQNQQNPQTQPRPPAPIKPNVPR